MLWTLSGYGSFLLNRTPFLIIDFASHGEPQQINSKYTKGPYYRSFQTVKKAQ